MQDFKIPITIVFAMLVQLAGGIWWVSQQAVTISSLEKTVSTLGSRMAIENTVNTKRDVQENKNELSRVHDDLEDVWEDMSSLTDAISEINQIKQRIAIIENEIKYISQNRDPREK